MTEPNNKSHGVRDSRYELLGSMSEAIHVVDADFRLSFANDRFFIWLEELGLQKATMGRPLKEILPFLPEEFFNECRHVFDTGKTVTSEEYILFGNSEYFTETQKLPLMEEGKVGGVVSIIRDVTESTKTRNLLVSERNKLQSLIDSLEYGFTIQNKDYDIIFQNEFMKTTFKNTMGMKCYQAYEFRETVCDGCPVKQSFQDGLSHTTERLVEMPSGEIKIWENTASPIRDSRDSIASCLEIVRDVTHRKTKEQAIVDSEAMYRSVVESSLYGFYIIQEGLFRFVNKRWSEIHGYTSDEAVDKLSPIDLVPPEDRHAVAEDIERMYGETDPVEYTTKSIRKDGRIITIRFFGRPMKYRGRRAISGTVIDITEKLALESQVRQSQKMEFIGRLAGGVAHDFNNMLSVIIGHTELALLTMDPSAPLFSHLQKINDASNRSAALVSQLLAFARKQTAVPRVLDLNNTVTGMLKMLRPLIGENIDFVSKLSTETCRVMIDPTQLDQILTNLCVNARDAISDVGRISVETEVWTFNEADCVHHSESLPGKYVALKVTDTGGGMDQHTLDNLFEPFFTTKDVNKGTGLGLATVYGIVQQNKGFIEVQSEVGHGTTFMVYLPKFDAEEVKWNGGKDDASTPPGGGETILWVEDEPVILEMGKLMLEQLGYHVVTASKPRDAVRIARERTSKIDLLITDVIMPEQNGWDLAQEVSTFIPHLKILFASGYSEDIVDARRMSAEGFSFIQKPFSLRKLADAVRAAIDTSG